MVECLLSTPDRGSNDFYYETDTATCRRSSRHAGHAHLAASVSTDARHLIGKHILRTANDFLQMLQGSAHKALHQTTSCLRPFRQSVYRRHLRFAFGSSLPLQPRGITVEADGRGCGEGDVADSRGGGLGCTGGRSGIATRIWTETRSDLDAGRSRAAREWLASRGSSLRGCYPVSRGTKRPIGEENLHEMVGGEQA